MTSTPESSSARSSSSEVPGSGCPAVTYATSALRPASRHVVNRAASGETSDEVVADTNPEAIGVLGFDDGTGEGPVFLAFREVHDVTRMHQVSHGVADDANDWPGQHVGQRVDCMHQAELEGVED